MAGSLTSNDKVHGSQPRLRIGHQGSGQETLASGSSISFFPSERSAKATFGWDKTLKTRRLGKLRILTSGIMASKLRGLFLRLNQCSTVFLNLQYDLSPDFQMLVHRSGSE
jgi:hypothetical protein